MSLTASKAEDSLKGQVSAEEWEARVNLAAAYRLVALYGWDDLVFTHISSRVPNSDHHFLINRFVSSTRKIMCRHSVSSQVAA